MYMVITLTAVFLFKVIDLQSGGTVYAMVDMNASASEMYIYVRTLGQNTINGIDGIIQDEFVVESQISHEMIMSEQNSESILEASIEVHAPQKYVNGLKIVNRGETELNKKELGMICRIVEAEAGGEDIAGRMLVANVILNRWFETRLKYLFKHGCHEFYKK